MSNKTVVVALREGEKTKNPRTFENTASGHLALIKALRGPGVSRVCLEATGAYHLDLAVALHDAGFEVMVINPKAAKRFAEALQTRNKTDAVDAAVLAEFAYRMPYEPWQRPDDRTLALRALSRRIAALRAACTQAKNQLHAATRTSFTPAALIADIELSIRQFEAQIDALRTEAQALIATDSALTRALDLLVSVKGIATASAIQILGELWALPPDMSAKQWVAMAGLDPRIVQSGSSVNKKPRLSKAGNRYLRMALFMPALSAARHDPNVKAYTEHLIRDRGLKVTIQVSLAKHEARRVNSPHA